MATANLSCDELSFSPILNVYLILAPGRGGNATKLELFLKKACKFQSMICLRDRSADDPTQTSALVNQLAQEYTHQEFTQNLKVFGLKLRYNKECRIISSGIGELF